MKNYHTQPCSSSLEQELLVNIFLQTEPQPSFCPQAELEKVQLHTMEVKLYQEVRHYCSNSLAIVYYFETRLI